MTDPLPIDAAKQLEQALLKNETGFNGSTIFELMDLVRSWMPQDVPVFHVGQRVRIGKCFGTVEHCPPRVRVRLFDGQDGVGEFLAKFVHPAPEETVKHCRESEGTTGIDCGLPADHEPPHVGTTTDKQADYVGYSMTVQWPVQEVSRG